LLGFALVDSRPKKRRKNKDKTHGNTFPSRASRPSPRLDGGHWGGRLFFARCFGGALDVVAVKTCATLLGAAAFGFLAALAAGGGGEALLGFALAALSLSLIN